jgi:hypothetical protein
MSRLIVLSHVILRKTDFTLKFAITVESAGAQKGARKHLALPKTKPRYRSSLVRFTQLNITETLWCVSRPVANLTTYKSIHFPFDAMTGGRI